ncbi:MAG: C39 family peptidase [bacterium]|nr:C39 family peptidase [bacterium]
MSMLNNIQQAMNRIEQIEKRINQGAQVDSMAFTQMFDKLNEPPVPKAIAQPQAGSGNINLNDIQGVNPQLWSLFNSRNAGVVDPSNFGAARMGEMGVKPLAQNNSVSCGQTSVAMAVNALTGQNLTDNDINSKYGFELLNALNSECNQAGYSWKDAGDLNSGSWELIDHKVNQEKTPVIVALNGPEFSPSGRGHIVTIVKTEGDTVTIADPATGALRTTTKQAMNNAPQHPDGNFVFYANRTGQDEVYMASAQ